MSHEHAGEMPTSEIRKGLYGMGNDLLAAAQTHHVEYPLALRFPASIPWLVSIVGGRCQRVNRGVDFPAPDGRLGRLMQRAQFALARSTGRGGLAAYPAAGAPGNDVRAIGLRLSSVHRCRAFPVALERGPRESFASRHHEG